MTPLHRSQIADQKQNGEQREAASGAAVVQSQSEGAASFLNGGGFAPGRMLTHYA